VNSHHPTIYAVLGIALLALPVSARKKQVEPIDPSQFTMAARVTGYSLRESTIVEGETSSRPSFCDTQKEEWQKSYCAAAGNHSYSNARRTKAYILTTEITDEVYELEGRNRLELGTYRVRIQGERVEFLKTGEKGEATAVPFRIVGKRAKDSK
jgi:hypothetical protein